MRLELTPTLQEFVRSLSETGEYSDANAVVCEALRLLRQERKTARLRALIQESDEAYARGDYITLDNDAELDEFSAKLRRGEISAERPPGETPDESVVTG